MSETAASRYALTFIFITMLIDTIGLGIIIPVTPKIITALTGHGLAADAAVSDAAVWGGWLMFVFGGMQFLCAPVIGNLSDRFGRRPILIISLVAIGIDYLLTGLAPSITWLFIARFLSGMAAAAYPTANAYIADVSPPEKRAQNFGLTGAAFGIGFVLGPAIGGVVGDAFGARAPFFLAAFIAFANAGFGFFVLKESLPLERRRAFELWRANPMGSLLAIKRYPMIIGLTGVIVLMALAHDANPATWTYYTMLKFHWTPAQVGYSLMGVGILVALVMGVLTRIAIPRIGETMAVFFGLFAEAVGFLGYAIATQGWMLYAWMVVWSLSGLANPGLQGIMSRQVPADEQGELQGALASVRSLTSVAAPLLLTRLFSWFTGPNAPVYFPGAAFVAAALCCVGAIVVFAFAVAKPRADAIELAQ
jgi:DHA1 family tetracycline resistance protein-like MFS transporter